jgi:MFS family permease
LREEDRRRTFNGIFAANFTSTFGETLPQSFQPLFLMGLGVPPTVIGLFYIVRNVVQTVVRIPIGRLSDALGRKQLMLIGLSFVSLVPLM